MDDVTGSMTNLALPVLAEHHTSLMHGWIPGTVQAVAVTVLLLTPMSAAAPRTEPVGR